MRTNKEFRPVRACGHSAFKSSRGERDPGSVRVPVPGGNAEASDKGRRDRKLRADVFEMPANTRKAQVLFDLWPLWRRGLLAELMVARRDMLAGRQPRKIIRKDAEAAEPEIAASKARVGAQEQQMIRAQAVAAVTSWTSNRRNDFRWAVTRRYTLSRWGGAAKRRFSALPAARRETIEAELVLLRHELYAINKARAWLVSAETPVMRTVDDGTKKGRLVPVSARARQLARTIFLGIVFRHRWPRFERLAMRFDDRVGFDRNNSKLWIEPADHGGLFAWWLHLKPTGAKAPVLLPIRGWGRDRDEDRGTGLFRPGALGKTVNVFLGDDGRLRAALTHEMTDVFAASRERYRPLTDVLALDFGLTNLFASSQGDLLGRGFMRKIRPLAERADREARRMQRAGHKPRESALYCDLVRRQRAMVETQVNRALNHLVAMRRPRVLAVEKLDFRGSALGRRMNRMLTNCGRGAVARKLADLADRYGIEIHEVDPAYTSKTCSCCGYVDAKNRKRGTEKFHCRFCGRRMHADVNGARNIAAAVTGPTGGIETGEADGRSDLRSTPSPVRRQRRLQTASPGPRARSFRLREIVRRFDESMAGPQAVSRPRRWDRLGVRESAEDPRLTNPYWKRHALLSGKSAEGRNAVAAGFSAAT